jgi:hypothetical protein
MAIPHVVGVVLAPEDRHLEAEDGMRPTSAPDIVRDYQRRVPRSARRRERDTSRPLAPHAVVDTDIARIVALVGALADGFSSLRQFAAPDGATEDEFAASAVGLIEALTTPFN